MICAVCKWCRFDVFKFNYQCIHDWGIIDRDVYSTDVDCEYFTNRHQSNIKWALETDNNIRIKVISDCRAKDCPHYGVKEKLREQYESELKKKNKGKRGVRK